MSEPNLDSGRIATLVDEIRIVQDETLTAVTEVQQSEREVQRTLRTFYEREKEILRAARQVKENLHSLNATFEEKKKIQRQFADQLNEYARRICKFQTSLQPMKLIDFGRDEGETTESQTAEERAASEDEFRTSEVRCSTPDQNSRDTEIILTEEGQRSDGGDKQPQEEQEGVAPSPNLEQEGVDALSPSDTVLMAKSEAEDYPEFAHIDEVFEIPQVANVNVVPVEDLAVPSTSGLQQSTTKAVDKVKYPTKTQPSDALSDKSDEEWLPQNMPKRKYRRRKNLEKSKSITPTSGLSTPEKRKRRRSDVKYVEQVDLDSPRQSKMNASNKIHETLYEEVITIEDDSSSSGGEDTEKEKEATSVPKLEAITEEGNGSDSEQESSTGKDEEPEKTMGTQRCSVKLTRDPSIHRSTTVKIISDHTYREGKLVNPITGDNARVLFPRWGNAAEGAKGEERVQQVTIEESSAQPEVPPHQRSGASDSPE